MTFFFSHQKLYLESFMFIKELKITIDTYIQNWSVCLRLSETQQFLSSFESLGDV